MQVTSATQQPSNWAKWTRKIYETDSLTCSECGVPIRIIAFITDSHEVAKILEYTREQTSRDTPLKPNNPVPCFSDCDGTNFQHAAVPWYPETPVLDF